MPDWAELTAALAFDAETAPDTPPTIVAQRYEQRFGRVQLIEAVRDLLYPDKSRPGKAHRVFVHLPFDTVYTTNFDLLLEDAYSDARRPYRSLVGELQLPFHAGQIASNIVKMHGDIRHEEHITITKADYDSFMDRYPVVATHLSAMLITRTPLFLGYSLSDPDFDNIRKVVKARLGVFERMAYVVQFDVPPERIEQALDSKLHIVSIDSSSGASRDDALASFFETVQEQLDTKAGATLRKSRPDLFEEIKPEIIQRVAQSPVQAPIVETASKLCFVMMPFGSRFDEIYRLMIAPAAAENGLTVLRADEMTGQGFVTEQIRAAIQQSRLCIADVTGGNPNVMWEIGFAQAAHKSLVIIAEWGSSLPFDVAHQRVITYGEGVTGGRETLSRAISTTLWQDQLQKAAELFDMKVYRAAIAAASLVLEQKLRHLVNPVLRRKPNEKIPGLGQLLNIALRQKLIPIELSVPLKDTISLRNHAIHEADEPTREQAELVLSTVRIVLDSLRETDGQTSVKAD